MTIDYYDIVLFVTIYDGNKKLLSIGYLYNNSEKFVMFDHNENIVFTDILPEHDTINFLVSCYNNKYKIDHEDFTRISLEINGYQVINTPLKDIFQILSPNSGYNFDIY